MQTYVFAFLGGLALFIYGMKLMGEGLQKAAGDKMQRFLSVLTGVTVVGVLVGALVTAVIQSSSATTVMTVGLVNAGLLTLKQAFSIIMGANIGTTITAQLIAFKLTKYVKLVLAIGFAMNFIAKNKKYKYIGQIILGFGILMLGMEMMSDAVLPLKDYPGFVEFIKNFNHQPLLGVLVGIVMTVVIQSSSATIGILMTMSAQGLIPLEGAIPVLLGDNIGTCITAILAAIGTNITARRTALAHVMFNVVGALVFILFMDYFVKLVVLVSPANDFSRQIANAHTAFNVLNALLFIPFSAKFVEGICRLLPGEEKIVSRKPLFLDENMLGTPVIAISLASKEVIRMANLAKDNLSMAMQAMFERDEKKAQYVYEHEPVIDSLEEGVTLYLTKMSEVVMSQELSGRHTAMLHACNDIERIGDHAESLAKQASHLIEENKFVFSEAALKEMRELTVLVEECYDFAISAMELDDEEMARKSLAVSDEVRELHRKIRKNHINRVNEKQCNPVAGFMLIEMLVNLKRISDHSRNLAQLVLGIF